MKRRNIILRVSDTDAAILSMKSAISGKSKSELIRESFISHWPRSICPADTLLQMYREGDQNDRDSIIHCLAEFHRQNGYPHVRMTNRKADREMEKIAASPSPLLEDGSLTMNTVGVGMANSFHPQMAKVRCMKGYRTPYETYQNDEFLRDVIRRVLDLGWKPTEAMVRKMLRVRDGVRSVVNFKPVISRFVYQQFCPSGGKSLDPCAGFGGRLAGCIASNRGLLYHGIDPTADTAAGNTRMAGAFSSIHGVFGPKWKFRFRFDLGCAEDVMPTLQGSSYDLVFTSPPYFDVEKYSDDPNQSYRRYPVYQEWRDKFMAVVISQSARVLRSGGHLVLNVKNYRKAPLVDDAMSIASETGLVFVTEHPMRLANSEFFRKEGKPKFHTEPILAWKKP